MKVSLTARIFIGMLLAILLGHWYNITHTAAELEVFASRISILSDIFLRLIKMIIAPLVFATLVVGVAKVGDFKSVGRIGLKTILYFQFATILALLLGLLLVNFFEPGKIMSLQIPAQSAATGVSAKGLNAKDFITHVIP